jgi:hypothetical protein
MFVFGVPSHIVLRARGFRAVWIAVATGFVIGALMWLVFSILFVLSLDQGFSGVRRSLADVRSVLFPGGVLGAIVGGLFWSVARPDRKLSWHLTELNAFRHLRSVTRARVALKSVAPMSSGRVSIIPLRVAQIEVDCSAGDGRNELERNTNPAILIDGEPLATLRLGSHTSSQLINSRPICHHTVMIGDLIR